MSALTLSYSLADQTFERTKSLGILNLSTRLAEHLARSEAFQRFTLFSNTSLQSALDLPGHVQAQNFDRAAHSRFGRIAWDQWNCYSAANRSGNDWLFLPKGFASFVRPPSVRVAAYVHDAMHDFYSERFPTAMPAFERWYFPKSLLATLRDADVIFTNTEFTRTEVLRLARKLGLPEPRALVAGIGFSNGDTAARQKRDRIVVLVGRLPHKRSDLAVSWTSRWQEQTKWNGEIHLVGVLPDDIAAPQQVGWTSHVRLNDGEYKDLMSTARAMVYFSEYEGFGMPPVEATLAGACPIFSELAATREVMGSAGFHFLNDSFDSFSHAMTRALSASNEMLADWRDELLARHSWDRVVERIVMGLSGT